MDGSEEKLRSCTLTECTYGALILDVKAVAMTVDESTELWVPVKGNTVANITLYKHNTDYSIIGQRMIDKQEIFNCKLQPSTRYQKADATFHHWTTGCQRQGLTFLHLSEARKFERLVRKAIKDISPKRDSQSEEEIFVNSDSLMLDCDTLAQSGVPLRPHKPKRLTEEYRISGSSKDSSIKHKNSSSSEEDCRSRRGSPSSVGASQVKSVDHRSNNSSPHSDTSLPTRDQLRLTACSHVHQPTQHSSSHSNTTAAHLPKSNLYVQPGETLHSEPLLPPKASHRPSHAVADKPTAHAVTARKGQYSDYRNDCYIKQDKDKSVTVGESASTEILTQHTEGGDDSGTNLKSIKNTPPLPRKKKRHRQALNLCCFTSNHNGQQDESV